MQEKERALWNVNVGDGDNVMVEAESLAEVERMLGSDWRGMINAVVRVGHEALLRDWKPMREAKR